MFGENIRLLMLAAMVGTSNEADEVAAGNSNLLAVRANKLNY